jgi:hypothetical protein
MEVSTTQEAIHVAVTMVRVDRDALESVLRASEPVVSVYLGKVPAVTQEYQLEWSSRWRPLADALRGRGAAGAAISALEQGLVPISSARAASGAVEAVAFATDGQVVAAFPAPGATWPDMVRVDPPAQVLPLLAWAQDRPPYVAVVVDRAGADIQVCRGFGSRPTQLTVDGPDDEIVRNAPGGFLAQGRYQRRAEDSWRHNAGAVAEMVTAALERVRSHVLVVSGDVRAVQFLRQRLPAWVRHSVLVEEIKGGRAIDGSQESRHELVADAVRREVRRQLDDLWRSFAEQRSPGGLAVEGAHATLDALAAGRVGTLLVVEEYDDERKAWFGAGATDVQPMDQPPPAWPEPRQGQLTDVAVRAALLTGAEVRVLPADAQDRPAEGIGGICRFR